MRSDAACQNRLLRSYKLMLHFYGMELANETTGEIKRDYRWACV